MQGRGGLSLPCRPQLGQSIHQRAVGPAVSWEPNWAEGQGPRFLSTWVPRAKAPRESQQEWYYQPWPSLGSHTVSPLLHSGHSGSHKVLRKVEGRSTDPAAWWGLVRFWNSKRNWKRRCSHFWKYSLPQTPFTDVVCGVCQSCLYAHQVISSL